VRANKIQKRDNIYIEPSSEAAYEKQRRSKILPNRGQRRSGKEKPKWSLGERGLPWQPEAY